MFCKTSEFSYLDTVRGNEERQVESYLSYGETGWDEINEVMC